MKIIMRRVSMIFEIENHGYDNAKGGVYQIIVLQCKILAVFTKHFFPDKDTG